MSKQSEQHKNEVGLSSLVYSKHYFVE